MIVEYLVSNENVEQIVQALDPSPEDRILAICGSGDQVFALAESGARVVAFDKDSYQLDYAKRRAELIREEEYGEFLSRIAGFSGFRAMIKGYFSEPGRLNRIRNNLPRVSFLESGITNLNEEKIGKSNKIYASNAIGYRGFAEALNELGIIASFLPTDGLLYVANGYFVKQTISCVKEFKDQFELIEEFADTSHAWDPMLFRKVGGT